MIPDNKREGVTRALNEAFGVSAFEDIRSITKGHTSALVFRIVVHGRPYLLRLAMHSYAAVGPARQFTCMGIASQAGIAPRVLYSSAEDQILIADFIQEVPLTAEDALKRMPGALRSLHALPPFPELTNAAFNTTCMFLLNKGPAVDGFFQKFQAANIVSDSEFKELLGWHERLAAAYQRDRAEMVSSHNDLFKPDNILFDGQRIWLVDWEAAFLNDRYADLAVVANMLVTGDDEEKAFVREYLGHAPGEYELARLFVARQLAHMFYGTAFQLIGASDVPADASESTPDYADFHRRYWAGEIDMTNKQMKRQYGRVHLKRFFENAHTGRFTEALRVVARTSAGASVGAEQTAY